MAEFLPKAFEISFMGFASGIEAESDHSHIAPAQFRHKGSTNQLQSRLLRRVVLLDALITCPAGADTVFERAGPALASWDDVIYRAIFGRASVLEFPPFFIAVPVLADILVPRIDCLVGEPDVFLFQLVAYKVEQTDDQGSRHLENDAVSGDTCTYLPVFISFDYFHFAFDAKLYGVPEGALPPVGPL
jgi:hypothetical protein